MLNDTQCRNAKPKDKPYKLTDGNGLVLEVKPNGMKAWRYRFELAGKESMFAIGDYAPHPLAKPRTKLQHGAAGGVSPAEAREERTKARALRSSTSTWGVIEGNILQDAATQNCLMAKPDFMLNVTLNGEKQITGVAAGDVIAAHREGGFVKETAMYAVDEPFDIVVTTNSAIRSIRICIRPSRV